MGFQKSISYKNPRHGAPGPIGTSKSIDPRKPLVAADAGCVVSEFSLEALADPPRHCICN